MPVILQDPRRLPWLEWLQHPQSVMEPDWHGPVRTMVKLLGLDDPTQVMALGVPLEVGPMGGGALAAAAAKFPRFARALEVVKELPGFFSRVDEAAAGLPAVAAPAKVASVLKQAASGEEILARGVPEWLAGQGPKVTREAVQAHLAEHPLTVNITQRGASTDPAHVVAARDFLANGYGPAETLEGLRTAYARAAPGELEGALHAAQHPNYPAGPTKYQQFQVPGGTNYRETLITLPPPVRDQAAANAQIKTLEAKLQGLYAQAEATGGRDMSVYAAIEEAQHDLRATMHELSQDPPNLFKSSHFAEPNILAHVRSNDRALATGEPGRFLEEVQSDWHQAGKTKGYAPAPGSAAAAQLEAERGAATRAHGATIAEMDAAYERVQGTGSEEYRALADQLYDAKAEWRRLGDTPGMAGAPGTPVRDAYLRAAGEVDRLSAALETLHGQHQAQYQAAMRANRAAADRVEAAEKALRGGVPDAPFKDAWPDLALKQQLLETAADPSATWIGHTTGATQAERYSLAKQIDQLHWSPSPTGAGYLEAMKDGSPVLQRLVKAEDLPDLIGKEAAKKLLETPARQGYAQRPLHTLEGIDLQIGGEGMKYFYDTLLPKRLEKIVKPFGGTVEKSAIATERKLFQRADGWYAEVAHEAPDGPFPTRDAAANHWPADPVPAWVVRLTPEMKARILREGVSLLSLGGLAAGVGAPASVASGDQNPTD